MHMLILRFCLFLIINIIIVKHAYQCDGTNISYFINFTTKRKETGIPSLSEPPVLASPFSPFFLYSAATLLLLIRVINN